MNIAQLSYALWVARHKQPDVFTTYYITCDHAPFLLKKRESKITVINNNIKYKAIIVYADQSPLGISAEARLVRYGNKSPIDVGWLWYQTENSRTWLSKTINGRVCPFVKGAYNKNTKILTLY